MPVYNEGVKRPGVEHNYTPDEIKEIIKCKDDFIYFLKNYVKIIHPDRGLVLFDPWDYQIELAELIKNNRFVIALIARQQGKTILVAAYFLWYAIFNENKSAGVVSNNEDGAIDVLDRLKGQYEELPDFMKPGIVEYNKKTITFENGTRIRARATSKDSFRGRTLNLIVCDEFAFVDPPEKCNEFFTANWPTISASQESKFIIISCVTKETFLFTSKGPLQFSDIIDNTKQDAYYIDDIGILGKDKLRTCDVIVNNGKCETKKIFTINSYIECTHPHKLWSYSNGKFDYHKSKDLNVGDWISIQYGNNIWGNNDDVSDFTPSTYKVINKFSVKTITKEMAYFLGMFLAEGSSYVRYNEDGSIKNGAITLTCGDDISKCITDIGLPYSKTKGDDLHYTVSSKNLIEFLTYLGFDLSLRAKNKYIPQRLMEMSRENIIYMLRGIFDGDGYSRSDRGYIGISLSSKRMVHQIRNILINFGILTDYSEVLSKQTKMVSSESMSYRIMTNGSDAIKFFDEIGFGFARKMENRNAINPTSYTTKDNIPYVSELFKNVLRRSPYTLKSIEEGHGIRLHKAFYTKSNMCRRNALKLYDILKPYMTEKELCLCDGVIADNIKWVKINKIEDGYDETFDVALPDIEGDNWDHSVIYNGIIGHQTAKGIGNLFHKIYTEAEQGINTFKHYFADWRRHPDRDIQWAIEQRKNLGNRQFEQEFGCVSGESIITVRDKTNGNITSIKISILYESLISYGILARNFIYEILTPKGYKCFTGIQKLYKGAMKFYCENNISCEVSIDHTFNIDNKDINASSLTIGDYLDSNNGKVKIIDIQPSGIIDVYDPINVLEGNVYYADSVLHHNCSFLGSASTVVDDTTLKVLVESQTPDPIEYADNGNFRVYEKPINGCQYILGVDCAKGTGEHYSTIQILKINKLIPVSLKQVAVFESNTTDIYKFSSIVNNIALYYNNAFIMVENNSEGSTVVNQLWWEYENENLVCEGTKSTNLGVRATTKTKPIAVLFMKKLIEDGCIEINDRETINQLLTFIDHGNNKFSGNGNTDDLISALYWATYFFQFDLLDESYEFKKDEEEDDWGILTDNDPVEDGYKILVK